MKPNESLAHAFGSMGRLVERELRGALGEYRVQPGELPVLLALYESDGMTQAQLTESVHVEQPTMAATLGRMERHGFVARQPDPDDGRRVAVHLTERARQMEKPITDAVRAVNRRALRGLSADERNLLYNLPDRLQQNLD
jgi:DNA-binding MarR family transcriptional regulator